MNRVLAAALLLASATAHAGERLAVATNLPIRWDKSFGGSLYVGVSNKLAVRANVATYDDLRLAGIFNTGYDGSTDGRTTDLGAGVVYYPRRLWDGLTLEWATTSPPPIANFGELAEVTSPEPLLDWREPETEKASS